MPILGAVVLLIQLCFAYHALKTGRAWWWIGIIMAMPVAGCLLYYFIEVFPNTRESRKAERTKKAIEIRLNNLTNRPARSISFRSFPDSNQSTREGIGDKDRLSAKSSSGHAADEASGGASTLTLKLFDSSRANSLI